MTTTAPQDQTPGTIGLLVLYVLSVAMVLIGLMNATPGIPGFDALAATLLGHEGARLRKFPFEWFYPLMFVIMMVIVVLKHSIWKEWRSRSPLRRRLGLLMDIALVLMAFTVAVTYLVEIESVCLVDRITGDRARMIEESLAAAAAFNESFGLPVPTTVEDPQCLNTTGGWLVLIVGLAVVVFLSYNIRYRVEIRIPAFDSASTILRGLARTSGSRKSSAISSMTAHQPAAPADPAEF